jgi:predicted lipoprotein with Yx(FWY)xxD motif
MPHMSWRPAPAGREDMLLAGRLHQPGRRTIATAVRTSRSTMFRPLPVLLAAAMMAGLTACTGSPHHTSAGTPSVSTSRSPRSGSTSPLRLSAVASAYGTILEVGAGYPLYAFTQDTQTTSACAGACASSWRPLLAAAFPLLGPGVRTDLIGHVHRPDGSIQLSYAGHPLYTDRADRSPGQIDGENKTAYGGRWQLVQTSGTPARAPQPSPTPSSGGAGA